MRNQSSQTMSSPTPEAGFRYKPISTQSAVRTSYSLRDDIRIVLARKWIVLFIFLASIAATFYYLKTATPVYQTQVMIMREETEQLPASILEITPFAPKESLQSHIELLRSSSSVAEIKNRLKSDYHLEFTVPQIIEHFSLAYGTDNSIIKITATASIPKQAEALANAVAEFYIEKVAEMKSTHLDKGVSFLEQHVESVDKKLQQAEETLNKFREQEGILALPQTTSLSPTTSAIGSIISGGLVDKLGGMYAELSKTETDIEWLESQLQSVQTLISEKKTSLSSLTTSFPPQIDQIQSKLVDLNLELDTMREQFTEKDIQVITVQRQIDALQKRLEAELAQLLKEGRGDFDPLSELQELVQQSISLNVQLRGLKQKSVILKQKINTFKEEHPELIAKQVEFTRLERQARVLEQSYTMLLDKHEEMLLLKEMKTSGLRILDSAVLPQFPISPKKNRTLIFGFMIGLVLGVGIAFFLEYIDDSIKLKEDVERYLALPVMGTIPKISPFKVPESALSRREQAEGGRQKAEGGSNNNPSNSTHNEAEGCVAGAVARLPKQNEATSEAITNESDANRNATKVQRIGNSLQLPVTSPSPITSHQLPEANDDDEQSVRRARRSRHAKGHRKRIKRLLTSIILYADRKNPVIVRYRTLAANIKYANVDTPIQSLLVTSAAPLEGKTSTATNLAISMAQTGSKVLLIDTDLRRPRIHRIFQQDRSPGLTELLTDETNSIPSLRSRAGEELYAVSRLKSPLPPLGKGEIEASVNSQENPSSYEPFIRPTSIDNLYLLPCGAHISTPEGLLSSEKMKQLIESLSEQYDIIIFDSPPLVSSADAMILATQVDATLMVVRSGETKRQIALQGKELLENVDANIIGAVLNNIDYSKQYGSYYYYYYYYRSYYYSGDDDEN